MKIIVGPCTNQVQVLSDSGKDITEMLCIKKIELYADAHSDATVAVLHVYAECQFEVFQNNLIIEKTGESAHG